MFGVFIPTTKTAFDELRVHLNLYEQASGAKLNLEKSIIVPIALTANPDWLETTGCIIAEDREVIKYLGAPYGSNITSIAVQNFCLDKLCKRIQTYSSQHITFTGRVQIIKQVLLSMPVYHLMYLNLPVSARTKINRLCKDFLWGYSKQGNRKTPLVAWNRLVKLKKHGGLAIKDITTQNTALLAR